jgi:hypothetical protein
MCTNSDPYDKASDLLVHILKATDNMAEKCGK